MMIYLGILALILLVLKVQPYYDCSQGATKLLKKLVRMALDKFKVA